MIQVFPISMYTTGGGVRHDTGVSNIHVYNRVRGVVVVVRGVWGL